MTKYNHIYISLYNLFIVFTVKKNEIDYYQAFIGTPSFVDFWDVTLDRLLSSADLLIIGNFFDDPILF